MAEQFFRQERERTCVVASLRSVLATQFGVVIPEAVLRFAGDDAREPILKTGAHTREMRLMLAVANRAANAGPRWRLRISRHATVADIAREIRAGRYPLVHVYGGGQTDLSHMIVLCGYKPGYVRFFDPYDGRRRWIGSGAFRRMWLEPTYGETWLGVVSG